MHLVKRGSPYCILQWRSQLGIYPFTTQDPSLTFKLKITHNLSTITYLLSTANSSTFVFFPSILPFHFVWLVWLISHMAFLRKYGDNKDGSLSKAEKEIFSMGFMQKYKMKYFLKRRFPVLHNQLVSVKKKF